MSPRTFVTRGATLLALATLGLAACETKTIVQPPPENIQVFVTPSTATLTTVGQTVQFVAQVTGTSSTQTGGVTWTSSNTAVATVAATGNTATVTAKANGIATITATSTDNAARAAAATVTVAIAGTDTTKVAPPDRKSVV